MQLYCEPDSAAAVLATWSGRLGEQAYVLSRADAVAAGWFGPVAPHVLDRIGEVVVACRPGLAVVDSRRMRPTLLALVVVRMRWPQQQLCSAAEKAYA